MNLRGFISRRYIGARQNSTALIVGVFTIYGIIWAVLEPIMAIVPSVNVSFSGWDRFIILISVSLVIGFFSIKRPNKVKFRFQNTTVIIEFGDLFLQPGIRVVPVSQFMHELDVVSTSLQAIVIRRFVDDYEGMQGVSKYEAALNEALSDKSAQKITRFEEKGVERFYPLGTSVILRHADESYLFFAVTKTELKGHIPPDNCDSSKLWTALRSMWDEARIQSRGKDINIPLIGSGMTGINLSPRRILELNLLSLLSTLVENGNITTGVIRVVLHSKYFEQINLDQFRRSWRVPN